MGAGIKDLVLIYVENKPTFYARLEDIIPDIKPGWWQVKLLALSIPTKLLTWILEEDQINGKDFAMSGIPIRLEKVISPADHPSHGEKGIADSPSTEKGRVISLLDRKKR